MTDTTPLWNFDALPKCGRVNAAAKFDVVIVGGGITGMTAAYLLQQSGKRVALLERRNLAAGDTGNTTAHLTAITDLRVSELVHNFGEDAARLVWRGGMAAIATIEAIAAGHDCEFQRVPGFLHLSLDDEDHDKQRLVEEAEMIRQFGGAATFTASVPHFNLPGIRVADQAKFEPLKYLAYLAQQFAAAGNGAIYEESEVTEVRDGDPVTVVVNDDVEITCDYLIIATHVPLMGKTGLVSATAFQTKIASYTSYVVGAKIAKNTVPLALFWDTTDPYYYLRVDAHESHDYLIFGGCDHKTGQIDDTYEPFAKLGDKLLDIVPGAEIDHRWSGQVIETHDGLPYVGETSKRQFVATGFSGNGMTFGTLAAMIACDRVLGRDNPWADLLSVNRKKVAAGALNYLRENMDYPYYIVGDRFSSAEGTSTDDVAVGEGKLLHLDGQRVACSRSDDGELCTVSAVCTHMGCFVRWNTAERTWDCPCHGSRFSPSGEVLAGPAETPLEPVEVKETAASTS